MDTVEKLAIERVTSDSKTSGEDIVTRELPLTIILNGQELVTLLCSPEYMDYLAVGFLASEGLIRGKEDIKRVLVDDGRGVVRVETAGDIRDAGELIFKRFITSGCGRGASFYRATDAQGEGKVESGTTIPAADIIALTREFQHRSYMYRTTGGVHSAALCDTRSILVFHDDIGRHNAVDKIFGECILKGIPTAGNIIITSGRISSEILLKVVKRGVPILVSRSAPTSLGVKLAQDMGVTLVGFVRGARMNVYTHGWRVVTDGRQGDAL